jgi:hypothetical protein
VVLEGVESCSPVSAVALKLIEKLPLIVKVGLGARTSWLFVL